MGQEIAKLIVALIMYGLIVGVSIAGMIYGWGLEIKSLGWIVVCSLGSLFLAVVVQTLNKD